MDLSTLKARLSKYGNDVSGEELALFHAKPEFAIDNILHLKKEQYSLGLGNTDVFCNWMENKLKRYGSMKGGNSSIFRIWHGVRKNVATTKGYQCTKKYAQTPFDIDKSFEIIKKDLYDLLIAGKYEDFAKIDSNNLSEIFKSKILSVYYPEKYLCIFAKNHLINIKNLLEIELLDEDSLWEIKKSVANWQKEHMPHLNIWSFMRALYNEFHAEITGAYVPTAKTLILCDIEYIKTLSPKTVSGGKHKPIDYQEKQARQSRVGRKGEELVLKYEQDRLVGYKNQPVDYSADLSKHFDILSYDPLTDKEIHIEVKTKVNFNNGLDFYITDYEKRQLESDPCYALYYVTDINTQPKLFILDTSKMKGATPEVKLAPSVYRVQHEIKIK